MRKHRFTPAAQRVFDAASHWQCSQEPRWGIPELLIGLLSETECRAAVWLREIGLTERKIQARFPALTPANDSRSSEEFSDEVADIISQVKQRFADLPGPLEFATEHIVLGLLLSDHKVGKWLVSQGLDRNKIERETCERAGISDTEVGSIPWPLETEAAEIETLTHQLPTEIQVPTTTASDLQEVGLWRILDAATNRAREALRVLEDYVRFVWDDRNLSSGLKMIRHQLAEICSSMSTESRLLSRETLRDVGTEISTGRELVRTNTEAVLTANFARLCESLRSLEEYTKIIDPQLSVQLESLRYQTYTLERLFAIRIRSHQVLANRRLYVLVSGKQSESAFRRLIEQLVAVNVPLIQLRDKQLPDRELLSRAILLREITESTSTLFIMNDRPDLARLANADGVHVGQEELSVKQARQILGPKPLIGVSTHNLSQARQAVVDGADYLGVGPTFPSQTKQFSELAGRAFLSEVSAETSLPAFAIGGITTKNLSQVLATGVTRVAVASAITEAQDPGEMARTFMAKLSGEK